jgi:hypothetical protein
VLNVLKPVLAAVNDAVASGTVGIKDSATKAKVQAVLVTIQTGLTAAQVILAGTVTVGNVEEVEHAQVLSMEYILTIPIEHYAWESWGAGFGWTQAKDWCSTHLPGDMVQVPTIQLGGGRASFGTLCNHPALRFAIQDSQSRHPRMWWPCNPNQPAWALRNIAAIQRFSLSRYL